MCLPYLHPKSAGGNVSLASTNPFDAPIIDPALLGTQVDVALMREAVKAGRAFVAAPAWEGYILREFGALAEAQTDEELDAFIRDQTDTIDHPVGTVKMGGADAALNADLTVKGTKGLRVVDASAFVSSTVRSIVLMLMCRACAALHSGGAHPGADVHSRRARCFPRI